MVTMDNNRQHIRYVDMLVNATPNPVTVYDDVTGELVTFEPVERHQRRAAMRTLPERQKAVFIMDVNLVRRFKNAGGDVAEMAYVKTTSAGRRDRENLHVFWDGTTFRGALKPMSVDESGDIARIVLAREHGIQVRLRNIHAELPGLPYACAVTPETPSVSTSVVVAS